MSQTYQFTVPGNPKGQARHRTRVVTAPGRQPLAMNYDPKEAKEWKNKVAFHALAAKIQPIVGAVSMEVHAFMPRPQRLMRKRDYDGAVFCESKPDWDNLGKGVCDALEGIAYANDSQVVDGRVIKMYHEKAGIPRTVITLSAMR